MTEDIIYQLGDRKDIVSSPIKIEYFNNLTHPEDRQDIFEKEPIIIVTEINSNLTTEKAKSQIKYFPDGSINRKRLNIAWRDVNIKVKIKGKKSQDKLILSQVSGEISSGEVLGIIGSSGAGKTTLMNFLSHKVKSRNLTSTGEVLINNSKTSTKAISALSCYVMQDDILEALMTPLEILMFTAKLKLDLPIRDIEYRVLKMIKDLHLDKCINTKVGNDTKRGISGGERKRTSIGVELISDPMIIFLDEPTTGLDSYNAYEVILLLKKLSREGKIVIFTIHQPSSEIYYLLDKINILANGKTVYFGDTRKCFDCFDLFNLHVPLNYNPFEHFLETTNVTAVDNIFILNKYPFLAEIEDRGIRYSKYVDELNMVYESNKENFLLKNNLVVGTINGDLEDTAQNLSPQTNTKK
jgi:ABC-type multidrug transport system ATPase subunit